MATIAENREKLKQGLANGTLRPVEVVEPGAPAPRLDAYPVQLNSFSRTSLPPAYVNSGDALRNFYHPAMPQIRIPGAFPTSFQVGAGIGSQATITAKGGSSASGLSFSNSAAGGDEVGGTIYGGGRYGGPYGKVTSDSLVNGYTYGKVLQTALTHNKINPSKAGVMSVGCRPFSITTACQYTQPSPTEIGFYWDGTNGSVLFQIYRDDDTVLTAAEQAVASGNLVVTGLTANTLYYFYPYYDETLGTISFPTNASGVGTPAVAFTTSNLLAQQQQILRYRIPLWSLLSINGIQTPSSGSGSGGSGGGGGGGGGGHWTS